MPNAKSPFTVDKRDSTPAEWQGGQMSRTRFHKTFTGDLVGTSVVEAIMLGVADGGPMVYVGIERFDVTLHGRRGTFHLVHSAVAHGGNSGGTWAVVAGSGTGELLGIRGTGEIAPTHDFTLDYQL